MNETETKAEHAFRAGKALTGEEWATLGPDYFRMLRADLKALGTPAAVAEIERRRAKRAAKREKVTQRLKLASHEDRGARNVRGIVTRPPYRHNRGGPTQHREAYSMSEYSTNETARPTLPRDEDGRLSAYAWPGGYPIYYHSRDGSEWCVECARQDDADPPIATWSVNYEDETHCDGCGAPIEAAYVDDDPIMAGYIEAGYSRAHAWRIIRAN